MDNSASAPANSSVIALVVEEIVNLLHPHTIYLYNQRISLKGEYISFKLCVIADFPDKTEAERSVYRNIDCAIPFDVLLYTPGEWEELSHNTAAFASHIIETGTVVYG